ncbi:hypothetical protein AB0M20_44555 [Actinoplanes sp. NPDC051633]|uniref:hypothetical protein n=1 Tax=Actinoplanes sp. NPDC051633 TaxID=3155670 RepID=UPI003436A9A3
MTGILGLITAAITALPPVLGKDKPPTAAATTVTVLMQNGDFRPPPAPEGVSQVDSCLVGRWTGTIYNRTFRVDDTPVELRPMPGASFGIIFRDDGTGTDMAIGETVLTGSAGGYNVTLTERGTSLFQFVGRGGDLALKTTDDKNYDYSVVINDQVIPKEHLQDSGAYTIRYMCSPGQLTLTSSFFHLEYAKG